MTDRIHTGDKAMNIKLEPHFLVEIFRVASEAQIYVNEALDSDEDIEVNPAVIDFFSKLISNHPQEEVRRWFLAELARLKEMQDDNNP